MRYSYNNGDYPIILSIVTKKTKFMQNIIRVFKRTTHYPVVKVSGMGTSYPKDDQTDSTKTT